MSALRRTIRTLLALSMVPAVVALAPPAEARPATGPSAPKVTVVDTLPKVVGFTFRYQGHTFRTGSDGTATVPRSAPNVVPGIAPVGLTVPLAKGAEASFDRWYALNKLNTTSTRIEVTTAVFTTARPVRLTFSNLQDAVVPRSSLGQIELKSSIGALISLSADKDSSLLQATRVIHDSNGLVSKEIYYTVQDVDVRGNNVVNRSQTKFYPSRDGTVDVPLLFFDASVRTRDALFGFGVGGTLRLEYPNGHIESKELGGDGRVALPGLPRGQYHLSVAGPGLKLVQPVVMSRPQHVDLKIFTWVDLATVAILALGIALGLFLLGRHFHQRRLARQKAVPPATVDVASVQPGPAPTRVISLPQPEPEPDPDPDPTDAPTGGASKTKTKVETKTKAKAKTAPVAVAVSAQHRTTDATSGRHIAQPAPPIFPRRGVL